MSFKKKEQGKRDFITLIGTLPPLKGNAYYCSALCKELSKKIKIEFISFKKLYPNFLYPGGVKEIDVNFNISENKNLRIRKKITYYNPLTWIWSGFAAHGRIVHSQWWSLPTAPIFLVIFTILKLRRKKIILTVHNVLPHEPSIFDKLLIRLVLAFGDRFIVHSEQSAEQLKTIFGIPLGKIKDIPMGVHDMYKDKTINKKKSRTILKLSPNRKIILLFGNLRRYKGIDDILKACSIIKKKTDVLLLIVGEPWIKWNEFDQLVKRYQLKQNVITYFKYVPISKVKLFFSAADLVVLPYKFFDAQSGIGNIALAFNKPLVVTKVGGLPQLVTDKKAIAEPRNPESLAKTILNIIRDKKLLKKLSEDSKELSKKYSWGNVAKETIKLYNELK